MTAMMMPVTMMIAAMEMATETETETAPAMAAVNRNWPMTRSI